MKSCPTCHRIFVDTQSSCPLDDARLTETTKGAPAGVGRHLGPYALIALLGEGGMGSIYIGQHTQLNRFVAVKVLRPELLSKKDNIARFFQEAHTINRLRHPNIVESIDLVEDVVEGAYCVLELLKGPDLKTRLSRGALPIDSAIHIGVQLADALGSVHGLGVVHRDLKPDNLILITRDGRDDFVKLIDFGIAQIGHEGASGVFGTAAYMAPEQGNSNVAVDKRADIYSLGVLMFEMVTGRHPFPSKTDSEYLVRHADSKLPSLRRLAPHCPPALELIISKCLEKRPENRYASADLVAVALRMINPQSRARGGRAGWLVAAVLFAGAAGAASFILVPKYFGAGAANAAAQKHAAAQAAEGQPTPVEAAPGGAPTEGANEARPAIVAIVEIDVVSTPKGASVYRVGETVALGVTPFTVPLSRSDKAVQMRFEMAGYESKTIEVPIAASLEIEVTLSRDREPVAAKSAVKFRKPEEKPKASVEPVKPKKVQREGVIDPFAN